GVIRRGGSGGAAALAGWLGRGAPRTTNERCYQPGGAFSGPRPAYPEGPAGLPLTPIGTRRWVGAFDAAARQNRAVNGRPAQTGKGRPRVSLISPVSGMPRAW